MIKRTTIELDEELLREAKRALGQPTTRATVEEALRRATVTANEEQRELAERQREYFKLLAKHADLDVLASDEMWRSPVGCSTRVPQREATILSSVRN